MKAVRFEKQTISLIDRPLPEIGANEALVKILLAGICATDIGIYNGYADFTGIAGHEFVGIVAQCPDYPERVGRRVVADINCGCGRCPACIAHAPRHCPERQTIGIRGRDGAFAEYCAVPVENLHVVPDPVETISAVFAEPLAAALEITQQLHIQYDTRIAVIGDGKLGILAALGLNHYSGRVQLIGRHLQKLALAERQGLSTVCADSEESVPSVCARLGRFDVTVDATGNPAGINLAIALTRPEGTVVVKTTSHRPSQIDLATVAVNELRMLGSRCGSLPLALRFLENRWLDVVPLVEAVYPLADFDQAFSHALRKTSLKVLLAME